MENKDERLLKVDDKGNVVAFENPLISCKYGMKDCLNRNIKCISCKNMSNYDWDFTDNF